ncbi:amino acid ABC transporter permease [Pseudocalidococcus azoricus]|uniref:amino acid ABC transporter permease n=1 Tax=Pseudocalidococcus azoricus TaxID=3110322 RepID=UPI002AF6BE2E|nr:amino acid ABC transporter permease [Pseudocalidococcus azoricus]
MPSPLLSRSTSPQAWLRKNLFATGFDTALTVVVGLGIVWVGWRLLAWLLFQAQWQVITQNWLRFLIGRYPLDQAWRIGLTIVLGLCLWGIGQYFRHVNRWVGILIGVGLTVWLIGGGLALTVVPTNLWTGLLLTLIVAVASIVLAFPLGIVLAVGRQSSLPGWRYGATVYIELVRGLPLIGILFMAQVMLPLVLPGTWQLDRLLRAVAGLVLFNAAYLAENIRGGWQAIPRGQFEAAAALGLKPSFVIALVILPQALRISIPAIAGQFIALLKDTALLSLFALLELTGIARAILAQPNYLGRYGEVYLFIGFLYWLFCFGLSWLSRHLEQTGK